MSVFRQTCLRADSSNFFQSSQKIPPFLFFFAVYFQAFLSLFIFFLSSPFAPSVPNDAVNMANATGVPAIFWSVLWITVAIGMLLLALRVYVDKRDKAFDAQRDLPFESKVEV